MENCKKEDIHPLCATEQQRVDILTKVLQKPIYMVISKIEMIIYFHQLEKNCWEIEWLHRCNTSGIPNAVILVRSLVHCPIIVTELQFFKRAVINERQYGKVFMSYEETFI